MATLTLSAPAKLNLFLHITSRRPDGYHNLQTLFQMLDCGDQLSFTPTVDAEIQFSCSDKSIENDSNLVVRAAKLLQPLASDKAGVKIHLDKQVPMGGGLGGGSSDAASTLLALNRLWQLNWPLHRLLPIGLSLGADVPFFLRGRNAWVEGIGEQIRPVSLPPSRFVVLKPNAGLETARIFRDPALQRDSETATITDFAVHPFGFGRNDLQPVAQALCPEIDQALQWLTTFGLSPRMTGSGSAVFAQLPPEVEMPSPPHGWQMRVCSNMAVHPLAGWATSDD